jgi:hypothetical protein
VAPLPPVSSSRSGPTLAEVGHSDDCANTTMFFDLMGQFRLESAFVRLIILVLGIYYLLSNMYIML